MRVDPSEEQIARVAGALDASPGGEGLRLLQEAIRRQVILFAEGEITSVSLSRLQRFCVGVGSALVTLERPEDLVRRRFPRVESLDAGDMSSDGEYVPAVSLTTLSPAPANETYGANATRGLIETLTQTAKEVAAAQAEATAKVRAKPSLVELIAALSGAKRMRLGKSVVESLEKQIRDFSET